MSTVKLIHPVYLDVPMLVSFAAALDGGVSFGSDVTKSSGSGSVDSSSASAEIGFSFLHFLRSNISGELSSETSEEDKEIRKESKAHTESSIAIILYDRCKKGK